MGFALRSRNLPLPPQKASIQQGVCLRVCKQIFLIKTIQSFSRYAASIRPDKTGQYSPVALTRDGML